MSRLNLVVDNVLSPPSRTNNNNASTTSTTTPGSTTSTSPAPPRGTTPIPTSAPATIITTSTSPAIPIPPPDHTHNQLHNHNHNHGSITTAPALAQASTTRTARPQKRARTHSRPTETPPPASTPASAPAPAPPPRRRAPTACQNCRARKTKCDGAKPVCGSCVKTGAKCVGGEDERELSVYEATSLRILDGIQRLEDILRTNITQPVPPPPAPPPPFPISVPIPSITTIRPPPPSSNPSVSPALSHLSTASASINLTASPTAPFHTPLFAPPPTGPNPTLNPAPEAGKLLRTPSRLDTVLRWRAVPQTYPPYGLLASLEAGAGEAAEVEIDMDLGAVRALLGRYAGGFHPGYPIVDMDMLEEAVLVAAFGEDGAGAGAVGGGKPWPWDARACLLLLACALGAVADDYNELYAAAAARGPGGWPGRGEGLGLGLGGRAHPHGQARAARMALGRVYWRMAQKRLGAVMTEGTQVAVQCLALAGFWHLYHISPLPAYKMFHSACLTWQILHGGEDSHYADSMIPDYNGYFGEPTHLFPPNMSYAQYLTQRLYWTILKAEYELRAELGLPVPTGAQLEYPLHFPAPPAEFRSRGVHENGDGDAEGGGESRDRQWYFYTAEMFLRRLNNRLVDEITAFETYLDDQDRRPHHNHTHNHPRSEKRLWALVAVVKEFEDYIAQWHASLPPSVRFPVPTTGGGAVEDPMAATVTIQPLPDERQQFIRKRYLDCHELLYRPFLNLLLNHHQPAHSPAPISPFHPPHPAPHTPGGGGKLDREIHRLASLGLLYTYWNLCADRGVWAQQGPRVWFDWRGRMAGVVVLKVAGSVVRVRGGAMGGGLRMPGGWEGVVSEAEEGVVGCWGGGWGGEGVDGAGVGSGVGMNGCRELVNWAREVLR